MSGIEIAGLILGAVPIVVKALKQYSQARRFWFDFRYKAARLELLIQALEEHEFLVRADLSEVLAEAGVRGDYKKRIDAGQALEVLKDKDVRKKVACYLGEGERFYSRKLRQCQGIISQLVGRIEGLVPVKRTTTVSPSKCKIAH